MKIDKNTKIKDLIPQGYELDENSYVYNKVPEFATFANDRWISLKLKPKQKSFSDYVNEYEENELGESLPTYSGNWKKGDKLGLLWYIIKDIGRGSEDLSDLSCLLCMILGDHSDTTKISREAFDVLNGHKYFIESIKSD